MSVLEEIARIERENASLREEIERLRAELPVSERATSEADRAEKLRARHEVCAALRREARELTDTLEARERDLGARRRSRQPPDLLGEIANVVDALLRRFRRGPP